MGCRSGCIWSVRIWATRGCCAPPPSTRPRAPGPTEGRQWREVSSCRESAPLTAQLNRMVHKNVGGGRDVRWKLIADHADGDARDSDERRNQPVFHSAKTHGASRQKAEPNLKEGPGGN